MHETSWFLWGLPLFLGSALIETVLAYRWTPGYFRNGIPIFKSRIEGTMLVDGVESQLENAMSSSMSSPMLFRRLSPQNIAFREQWRSGVFRYTPMMRGLIRVAPESHAIEVVGHLNWWLIPFVIVMTFSFWRSRRGEPWFVLIVAAIFALGYIFQSSRYRKIASLLRTLNNPYATR